MSECKLDHSAEDVKVKFESQQEFLPEEIAVLFTAYFEKEHSQEELNKIFHLLKKYDLAPVEERKERDGKLTELLKQD